jgi:hypothetical protein
MFLEISQFFNIVEFSGDEIDHKKENKSIKIESTSVQPSFMDFDPEQVSNRKNDNNIFCFELNNNKFLGFFKSLIQKREEKTFSPLRKEK